MVKISQMLGLGRALLLAKLFSYACGKITHDSEKLGIEERGIAMD